MIIFTLEEILLKNKISQNDLSIRTGIRATTISRIRKNKIKELPVSVIDRICDVLECDPGEWIEFRKE